MDASVIEMVKKVKMFYEEDWHPEKNQLMELIMTKERNLQELKKKHIKNSIACSKLSVISGGFTILGLIAGPPTCGLSFLCTAAGTATGLASGFAGVKNDIEYYRIVKENWEHTLKKMGKFVETSDTMVALLQQLQDICGFKTGIKFFPLIKIAKQMVSVCRRIHQLVNDLIAFLTYKLSKNPNLARELSKDTAKKGVMTVFGIAYDTYALCSSEKELSKLNNGDLCAEAKQLHDLKKNLQEENDSLEEIWKDILSLFS